MLKRLLIADDHALVLDGLSRILETTYDIVGTATNGRQLLQETERLRPHLIVLDIGMPEMNGIEAGIRLTKRHPEIKLVYLSQQLDRDTVRAAFEAGAKAFVGKQSPSAELLKAIRTVLRGSFYVTPLAVHESNFPQESARNPAHLFSTQLTDRQREVLQLVVEGKPMREIAAILSISIKTVEFHKSNLMRQLEINSTAELVRYAIAHRIVSA